MFKEIIAEFGSVDILVNNAGITRDGLLMKMTEEDYDAVLNTNLKGTFNCIRFVARDRKSVVEGKSEDVSCRGISQETTTVGQGAERGERRRCVENSGG